MSLKPDDLAQAMVDALPAAWARVKGSPFPGGNSDDAQVMFLAVARGLLTFLRGHQTDMVSQVNLTIPKVAAGPYEVTLVDVNTDLT
jgi:hypothetical protein